MILDGNGLRAVVALDAAVDGGGVDAGKEEAGEEEDEEEEEDGVRDSDSEASFISVECEL